jgi:hypothetical protein
MFGWKVAALYLGMGLLVAIVAGLVIGKLRMERHLEDWVQKILAGQVAQVNGEQLSWLERLQAGGAHVREIVGKVWPYVLVGIALGAGIHGYVPEDFMASFMGRDVWWAVPAAVLLGVPMYTNAAGIIPDCRSPDRQRRGPWYGPGFHDGRDRALGAGNDHSAESAQADPDSDLRRCRGDRHFAGRLHFQLAAVIHFFIR